MSGIAVSIVLPVANQGDHIAPIVHSYCRVLDELRSGYELILVVNNSGDDSIDICRALEAELRPRVSVFESEPGWGRAIRLGLAHATGRIIGFTNSARTQPADLLMAVRYATVNDAYLLKGNRKRRRSYSLTRRLGSSVYNRECRTLFGLEVGDVNGNPKLWRRDLVSPGDLHEDGALLDLEVLMLAQERDIPVVEFPVIVTRRHGGESMTTLKLARSLYTRPLAMWGQRGRRARP